MDLTTCLPAATSPDTAPLEEVEDEDVDEVDELEGRDEEELDELDELDEELEELEDPDEDELVPSGPVHPAATRLAIIRGRIFFSWCFP